MHPDHLIYPSPSMSISETESLVGECEWESQDVGWDENWIATQESEERPSFPRTLSQPQRESLLKSSRSMSFSSFILSNELDQILAKSSSHREGSNLGDLGTKSTVSRNSNASLFTAVYMLCGWIHTIGFAVLSIVLKVLGSPVC